MTMRRGVPLVAAFLSACGGGDAPTGTGPDADPDPEPDPGPAPAAVTVSHVALHPWPDPPDSLAPPDAGWPEVGSNVTWGAVLHNPGDLPSGDVVVRWSVDGAPVGVDTVAVPPGETVVELERSWTGEAEWIAVVLAGPDVVAGADSIRVASVGLSLGFHLQAPVWDWIDATAEGGVAAWAAREVDRWNEVLSAGRVVDRLRLQTLRRSAEFPDSIKTDLFWWFWNGADPRFAQSGSSRDVLGNQTIVLHELLHQRGLADLYAYRVRVGNHLSRLDIIDVGGAPALGSDRLPSPPNGFGIIWHWEETSWWLMGSDYRHRPALADVSAWGMNRFARQRTPRWTDPWGNRINALTWRNDYLLIMPEWVALQVVDVAGEPLAGATLEVFPDLGVTAYDDQYDSGPAWTGTADGAGVVTFPGSVIRPTPGEGLGSIAATAIVRVRVGGDWDYVFLPGVLVSTAVARGETGAVPVTLQANPR